MDTEPRGMGARRGRRAGAKRAGLDAGAAAYGSRQGGKTEGCLEEKRRKEEEEEKEEKEAALSLSLSSQIYCSLSSTFPFVHAREKRRKGEREQGCRVNPEVFNSKVNKVDSMHCDTVKSGVCAKEKANG